MTMPGVSHVYGKTYGGNGPENYERYFVPVIGAPLAHDLVTAAAVRSGERVLDAACGTGIVARLAAEQVGRSGSVAGVDVNAAMLGVARSAAAAARVPIQWYETSVEAMPLPDEAFDVVLCQLGLQFVTDKVAALREMRRVLVPGGRVLVSVPTPTAFFTVLHDAVARHVGSSAATFVQMVFSLNDTGEIQQLFRRAGFADATLQRDTKLLRLPTAKDFLWQYIQSTPLAATVSSLDDDRLAALERDVVSGWQAWMENGGLTYAQDIIVAAARK